MSARQVFRPLLLTLAVVGLAGCHTYRPVETPAIGSAVRVHLPVTSALSDPNAPTETVSVEGVTVEVGDTLVLATRTRREYGAFREVIQFDTIRLSAMQASSIDVREFSTGRSVVLGVALAGGAALAAVLAFNAENDGGSGRTPGPGDPPALSIVGSGSLLSAIWGLITR